MPTIVSPTLTDNTTPVQYTASASSNNSNAYKAFDGSTGTSWVPSTNSSGEWLQLDIAFNHNLDSYSITCPSVSTQAPTDFKLQGTLDGSTWYDLDIQTGLTTGWTDNVARTFNCNNLSVNVGVMPAYGIYVVGFTYFRLYRLYFTSQPSASVNISELVLLSSDKTATSTFESESFGKFATVTNDATNPVPNYSKSVNLSASVAFREGTYVPDTNTYDRPLTGQLFPRGLYFGAESLTINNTNTIVNNFLTPPPNLVNYNGGVNTVRLTEITATGGASVYISDLTGGSGTIYYPTGSFWNKLYADDPNLMWKYSSDAGATWNTGSPSTGKGILVIDMGAVNTISKLCAFQMISDGKVTHLTAYGHPEITSSAPLVSSSSWTPLFSEQTLGAGASTYNGYAAHSSPTIITFTAADTRYIKLECRNTGALGSGTYIELGGIKVFTE